MKKILIITPHYPPSNLAAVHRSRLFVKHLAAYGWNPFVLCVHERYYEEVLDWNLAKLLPENVVIEKVGALPITKPRMIGDIGLRGFFSLFFRARKLIRQYDIDFVYIPIPSFYGALLGRLLKYSTGVPYGIDYIDPWVHTFPGSEKRFSRHWWSTKIARVLEPIAVKHAALITGVAEGYYKAVFERNPHLWKQAVSGAMPYGGEVDDHVQVRRMGITPYLFEKRPAKFQLVYAGAMLPRAFDPLKAIFQAIQANAELFEAVEFHFIGTGKTPDDSQGYQIKSLAQEYGLWEQVVFEYPRRIPYLDVLVHLDAADGVFILGSTEAHYTPSKTYQGVLSEKPILAVLHEASSAVRVLQETNAGIVLPFPGEEGIGMLVNSFNAVFSSYRQFAQVFTPEQVDREAFNTYSAKEITRQLAGLLDLAYNRT